MQAAYPRIASRQVARHICRPIGRMIVYKHDFPDQIGQRTIKKAHQFRYILPLIEGRNNNR